MVGSYLVLGKGNSGFLLSGGSFTTLTVPGASQTYAYGINNAGQIVGYYKGSDRMAHGFLLSGGSYTTIDLPNLPGREHQNGKCSAILAEDSFGIG
jgi:probable HAF family extracellular repeat protein